jgi:hypothetical protein
LVTFQGTLTSFVHTVNVFAIFGNDADTKAAGEMEERRFWARVQELLVWARILV